MFLVTVCGYCSILKKRRTERICASVVQRPICAVRQAVAPQVAGGRARSGRARVRSADATKLRTWIMYAQLRVMIRDDVGGVMKRGLKVDPKSGLYQC